MKKYASLMALVWLLAGLSACGGEHKSAGGKAVQSPPSGSVYAVGSTTRFIHDWSRPFDAVAGVDSGVRIMVAEIWYPVSQQSLAGAGNSYRRATYGDYVFGSRDMHQLMMTRTTFFHLTPETVRQGVTQVQIDAAIEELFNRERGSFIDAPLAEAGQPFPVVVMSHGDAGSRYNMETACEYLAAHGYVVIAPEHTGNSPYAMIGSDPALAEQGGDAKLREVMAPVMAMLNSHGAYGSEEGFGQSYTPLTQGRGTLDYLKDLDASLLQRLGDLRATLAELDRMNAEGQFAGSLALDRVGLMGRSFGGATTLVGIGMEPRFTAGFAVVPPGWADQRALLSQQALVPAGRESVLLSAEGENPLTRIHKPVFLLSGGEDDLIIGLEAHTGAATPPAADNPQPGLRQAYETATGPAVWAMLADSNHSTFGTSAGYWWPDLKPDTQARYFAPDVRFRLFDPRRAQEMQQQKALAFFDLFIRQDAASRTRLLDQTFSREGLSLESRNL